MVHGHEELTRRTKKIMSEKLHVSAWLEKTMETGPEVCLTKGRKRNKGK